MANIDTVKAITDNLETVLKKQGVNFTRKTFDDEKNIPASLIPLGEIRYQGEAFEYTHGERPGYAEAEYALKVVLREREGHDMMREQQKWAHLIRAALTVAALNIGSLVTSKLVSRVTTEAVGVDNSRTDGIAALLYTIKIRYREL